MTDRPQFKIQLKGRTDWFDLYKTTDNLQNSKSILNEDTLDPLTNGWDEGTPVVDLKEATEEAKKQFPGMKWILSNGVDVHVKGEKKVIKKETVLTTTSAPPDIFGQAMPSDSTAITRQFDGTLVRVKATRTEAGGLDPKKDLVAAQYAGM